MEEKETVEELQEGPADVIVEDLEREKTDKELLAEIKEMEMKLPKAGDEHDLGNGYKVVYYEIEPGMIGCRMERVEEAFKERDEAEQTEKTEEE